MIRRALWACAYWPLAALTLLAAGALLFLLSATDSLIEKKEGR